MMTQRANTNTITTVSRKPCDPVAPPPDDTCCEVTCLIQPRFFCGQLLTDSDLQAMVDWSRQRFALARYRDGWGIACGLTLRVDPRNHGGLIVSPGYAVDCCGNDILVCSDYIIDLGPYLPKPGCDDPGTPPPPSVMRMQPGAAGAQSGIEPVATATVDLVLHYNTQGAQSQTALGRGSCATGSSCEYSRTLETYTVEVRPVKTNGSGTALTPREAAIQARQDDYQARLKWLFRFLGQLIFQPNSKNLMAQYQNWIDAHPIETYPDLIYTIEDQLRPGNQDSLPPDFLFKLVMDYRLSLLRCNCFTCRQDSGVILGRAYLEQVARDAPFRLMHIYDTGDYRRRIGVSDLAHCAGTWPGCIETAPLLREPWSEVLRRLQQAGMPDTNISMQEHSELVNINLDEFEKYQYLLEQDAVVICLDQPVTVYTAKLGGQDPVVIGFSQNSNSSQDPNSIRGRGNNG